MGHICKQMCVQIYGITIFIESHFLHLALQLAQVPKELEQEGRILTPIPHEGPK